MPTFPKRKKRAKVEIPGSCQAPGSAGGKEIQIAPVPAGEASIQMLGEGGADHCESL